MEWGEWNMRSLLLAEESAHRWAKFGLRVVNPNNMNRNNEENRVSWWQK